MPAHLGRCVMNPQRDYIVTIRRDRQMITEKIHGAEVAAYTVTSSGPMADVRGVLWVEVTRPGEATITDIVPTATYRDYATSMARKVAA